MLSPNAIKRRQATIGRHAVILDWGSGELMPKSTAQFREQFRARSLNYWG
jgi:N-methylhydantoinase B